MEFWNEILIFLNNNFKIKKDYFGFFFSSAIFVTKTQEELFEIIAHNLINQCAY